MMLPTDSILNMKMELISHKLGSLQYRVPLSQHQVDCTDVHTALALYWRQTIFRINEPILYVNLLHSLDHSVNGLQIYGQLYGLL